MAAAAAAVSLPSNGITTVRGISEVQELLASRAELADWLDGWLAWHRKLDDRDDIDGESRLRCVDLLTLELDKGRIVNLLGAGTERRVAIRCVSRTDPTIEEDSSSFAGRTLRVHVTNMLMGQASPGLIEAHLQASQEIIDDWPETDYIDVDAPLLECQAGKKIFKALGAGAASRLQFAFEEPSLARLGLDTNYPTYHSVYYIAKRADARWPSIVRVNAESWR